MAAPARSGLWWGAALVGAAGVGGLLGGASWGAAATVGGAVTHLHLAWATFPGRRIPWHVALPGVMGGFLALAGALPTPMPVPVRLTFAVLGFQLLLAAAGASATPLGGPVPSFLVAGLGHATTLLGVSLLGTGADAGRAWLVLASGLGVVLVTTFWRQRHRGGPGEEWELLFLSTILAFVAAPVVARAWPATTTMALGVGVLSGLLASAVLALPPAGVRRVARSTSGVAPVVLHGVTAIALVNAVLFAFTLVSALALPVVIGVLFGWLLLSVFFEYRAVLHALRHLRRRPPAPEAELLPGEVTVVVVAASEADILRETLTANLALDAPLRLVVVPSVSSTDATVEVARRAERDHPDRVRIVLGTGGSKAEDLNLAWSVVETPFFLVLDADETLDLPSLRRARRVLQDRPDVGVVQGRKVARNWGESKLTRFVAAERRFSTWIDQPLQARDGGGHFAGSAALVRWACAFDANGWRGDTLTEDIDFTLRVTLGTRWRIAYEPSMIVWESDVRSLRDLVRQRTRWARGWAEVTALHLPGVWGARRRLGAVTTASWAWQLVTSVSAPWMVLLPLLTLVRALGVHPLFPLAVALPLAVLVLPSRGLAYAVAAWHDDVIPVPRRPLAFLELLADAYLWILVGWLVQLHALWLELSEAPQAWDVTGKRAPRLHGRAGGEA